jgi:hypothetical protein
MTMCPMRWIHCRGSYVQLSAVLITVKRSKRKTLKLLRGDPLAAFFFSVTAYSYDRQLKTTKIPRQALADGIDWTEQVCATALGFKLILVIFVVLPMLLNAGGSGASQYKSEFPTIGVLRSQCLLVPPAQVIRLCQLL